MKLFDFLRTQDRAVAPERSKVHLACWNQIEEPLDVYLRGEFDKWQAWQKKPNFERSHVVALIDLPEAHRWLFVGVYESHGYQKLEDGGHLYDLTPVPAYAEFAGRLLVHFERTRASYLLGENCTDRMSVVSLSAEPLKLDEFPGFKTVNISFDDLSYLARSGATSWRTALGSVAGVYLITDTKTGKLYVGSATGEGGIWDRWCQYVDGHGNNVRLKALVGAEGRERAKAYRFSVLEIADTHASSEEVLKRESHWKDVLWSRVHGWNAN